MTKLAFQRLPGFDPDIALPTYETKGAAGMDIRANFEDQKGVTLQSGARALIPSGFAMALEPGFEAQVRPRSGLALKHGISLVNTPGTIDADYRGPVGIILINHGAEPFTVNHGERIAQMVIAPVTQAEVFEVASLDETDRGSGGFGSTGTA